ncbi:MAG: PASTA domain-containing protein [Planctomycetota bacterium]
MPRLRWFVAACAALVVPAVVCAEVAEAGPRRVIPEVVDLPQAQAESYLQAAGFRARAVPSAAPGARGTVAAQSPGGFWYAETGTEVTIEVRGLAGGAPTPGPTPGPSIPGPVPPGPGVPPAADAPVLPSVVGRTENEALDALTAWSVKVVYVASAPGNEGRVTSMSPNGGTPLARNQVVTLSVGSAGAPPAGASVVPNVVGMTAEAANAALKAARLVPLLNTVPADAAAAGRVVSQEPAAGIVVARDSNVVVNVGAGAPSALLEAEVPDLRRFSEVEARARLAAAGLSITVLDRLVGAADANLVVDQSPAAGARVARGAAVSVTVGRILLLPIRVPEVLNAEADAAERTLKDLGFVVERGTALSLPGSQGRVIGQEPGGGATATRGSVVRIVVGATNTIQTVPVPDVTGMTEAVATQRLRADGFVVARATIPGAPNEAGLVRGTQPTARTPLPRGAQVTLVVAEAPAPPAAPPLPNYVGMDVASAQADLAARGMQIAITYVSSLPEGRVVAQNPPASTPLGRGAAVTLTVSRAPTLGAVMLIDPAPSASMPKNYGVVFRWTPVPEAEDYEFEIFKAKDDTWVVADHDIERKVEKRPSRVRTGTYQWHVRARRANGTITGPWSEFRRLTIY